jgi:hypothetical protein
MGDIVKHVYAAALMALLIGSAAQAQTAPPNDVVFGDSQSVTCNDISACWWTDLAAVRGDTWQNNAFNGDQVADQWIRAVSVYVPGANDRVHFQIGENDYLHYGTDTNKQAIFASAFEAVLYDLAGNVTPARTGCATTGTWENGPGMSFLTETALATCTVTFAGDVLALSYEIQDGDTGQAQVAVDGTYRFSLPMQGAASADTVNGTLFAPQISRTSGYGAGTHTLVITAVTSSTAPVLIDWVWQGTSNGRPVLAWTVPRGSYGFPGGFNFTAYLPTVTSQATLDPLVAVYAAAQGAAIAQAQADGLTNVEEVDAHSVAQIPGDTRDGLHLGYFGQRRIQATIQNILGH